MTENMTRLGARAVLIEDLRSRLGRLSGGQLTALAVAMIVAIGLGDYLTGYDLSVGLFYVAPVAMMAWYGSRLAGVLSASLSGVTWLVANSLNAPPQIPFSVIIWNTCIRFGFFAIIASLAAAVRAANLREKELARTDLLTGLMNGRAFREAAERELSRMGRSGQPLTVLYLDLDNFKGVNDRRGHGAGDAMLVAFARALEGMVRATDVVCRMGGDEFVVLLPDTSEAQGSAVGEKIRKGIGGNPQFSKEGVSVSIGVASVTDTSTRLDDLVTAADIAMYEAKAASKRTVQHRDSRLHQERIGPRLGPESP